MVSKRCCVCGDDKPLTAFYVSKARPDGRTSRCKACWRDRSVRRPTCLHCGSVFEVPLRRGVPPRVCSPACAQGRANSRRRHRRRVPVVFRECALCGESFECKAGSPQQVCRGKCASRANLLTRYGLSPASWNDLLRRQDGRCAVCGDGFGAKGPQIDHCHDTGRVRGVLCTRCNLGLGHVLDDRDRLHAMATYLARSDFDLRELCVR